jgi:hypothetical protein
MHTGFWCGSQKEGHHYENVDEGGKIILKLISEIQNRAVWTAFTWLRMGTSGVLL